MTARMLWADPRHDGAGMWTRTPPHSSTRLTLLGTVVVCLVLVLSFVLAQAGARQLICATHHDSHGHPTFQYCDGFPDKPTEPTR